MAVIQRRVADPRVLWLVRRFLKAPVIENRLRTPTKKGTPQGGVLSPLLANIYLNEFDQYWHEHWGQQTARQRQSQRKHGKASCVLFRYADDFILSAKGTREQVVPIMNSIRGFFKESLKLDLSTEKTRVVSLEDGFDFLGFHIQRVRLGQCSCVRIRPTQRNMLRLRHKLQAMLGLRANVDDPVMKITALNRVLKGWANYYKTANSAQQFRTGDFLAQRLFCQWYCRKYQIGVRRYLSEVLRNGRVTIQRGPGKAELFRMSSNRSMRSSLNHKLVWKYRAIGNPYINRDHITCIESENNPMVDAPDVQLIAPEYNDETFSGNRLLVLERDGWKCTQCGSRENLQAHHIQPVPKGTFDPKIVHRVENLQTLCERCHHSLSSKARHQGTALYPIEL